MSTEEDDAWAQLVSLTDLLVDPIMITKEKFMIGRAKDCDLSLSENKLVSGHHCYLERDSDGKVWLGDSSTNGTLLNLHTKISKGNRKELKHGDEFHVVYKKNEDTLNVGYVYQNMADLQSEMDETQEYSTDVMDATLADEDCNLVEEEKKSEREEKEDDDDRKDEPPAKKMKIEGTEDNKSKEKSKPEKDDKTKESEKSASQPEKDTNTEKDSSKALSGETTLKSSGDTPVKSDQQASSASKSTGGDIEEILICMICQEIMHDCVSLVCTRSVRVAIQTGWADQVNVPQMQVDRINKNHIVNNLIEAYLKEHPDKKRPDEDIKELDQKNKITKDMLYPNKKRQFDPDESDYSDSDEDEDDSNAGYTGIYSPAPVPVLFGFGNPVFGTLRAVTKCRQCPGYVDPQAGATNQTGTGITGMATAALNAVKNAVGLGGNQTAHATTTPAAGTSAVATADSQATEPSESVEAGPSGQGDFAEAKKKDDEKVMPDPPAYTCGANQNHVLCQCCLQPMPDRRQEYLRNPDDPNIRPQQCTVCYRAYCHAYWGCKKAECLGCISRFKDMVFGRKVLNTLILDNIFESEILKDYMDSKHITVNELRDKCMENLDNHTSSCRDQARFNMTSNTPLCYPCALRNFKDLAYSFRASIDRKDLPEKVTRRPDCYWGKNCRTQKNKPHHAQNFSHICDQTRTS